MTDDLPILARGLLRGLDRATLATSLATALAGQAGWPYASLVLIATAPDGSPLLLISRLAEHTKNLAAEPRLSLLLDGTAGHEDPLTGPRLTLLGRAAVSEDPRDRARFLARHPGAALYADFGDFAVWRVTVERGHFVAGFGRIRWIEAADLVIDPPPALTEAEPDIVAHMNADHADALDLYAQRLLGLSGSGWAMTGLDRDGLDLRRGGAVARLAFARPVATPEEARAELVRLAREARGRACP